MKILLNLQLILLIIAGSTSLTITHAQTPDQPLDLDFTETIEVAAPLIVEDADSDEHGAAVTHVTARQIEALNASDLPSALRRVPGVHISRHNPVGSFGGGDGGAIYIRGMGSGRPGSEISVTTDGAPRFVGVWTHPLMDVLPVAFTDTITVMKGAQPMQSGGMAFGTVSMDSSEREQQGSESIFNIGAGSWNTTLETFRYGMKQGDFDLYIGQMYNSSHGHRDNADGLLRNYYLHGGYQISNALRLTVKGHFADTSTGDPGPENTVSPYGRFDVTDDVAILALEHSSAKFQGKLTAYYDDGAIHWEQWDDTENIPFYTDTDWANSGARYKGIWQFSGQGRLVYGYDHDHYGGGYKEVTDAGVRLEKSDAHFSNSGPYAGVLYTLGTAVHITPSLGIRYTDNSIYGGEWAPQAGITIAFKDTQIHGSVSRGVNFPGLYARFMMENWGHNTLWRQLDPETVNHWEIGVTQQFGKHLRGDLTWFHDSGENRLIFTAPPPTFDNIDTFTIQGAELNLSLTLPHGMSAFLGGVILDKSPTDLPNAPDYTLTAGIGIDTDIGVSVSMDAERIGERYNYNPRFPGVRQALDPYNLVNARLQYRLPKRWQNLGIALWLAGENLLDTDYEYKPDYPMPGATVSGGIKFQWL